MIKREKICLKCFLVRWAMYFPVLLIALISVLTAGEASVANLDQLRFASGDISTADIRYGTYFFSIYRKF